MWWWVCEAGTESLGGGLNPASRSVATDRPSPSAAARSNRFGDLALGSALLWLCPLCSASNGGRSLLSGLSRVRRRGDPLSARQRALPTVAPPPTSAQPRKFKQGCGGWKGRSSERVWAGGHGGRAAEGQGDRGGERPPQGLGLGSKQLRSPLPFCSGEVVVAAGRTSPSAAEIARAAFIYTFLQFYTLPILFQPRQEGIENSRTRHRFHDRCDGDGGIGLRADDDAPTDDSVPGTVGLPLQLHRTQRRIEFTARGCSGRSPPITLELWPHHKWRSPARHKCMTGPLWRRPAATGLPACCCPCSVSPVSPQDEAVTGLSFEHF